MLQHRLSLSFLPLIAALLLNAAICHAADNEDFMDFQVQALGETATLYCNSTESEQAKAIPTLYEPIAWMLPNLTRVDNNDSEKHQLEDSNWTLVIHDTVIEDLGVYHCMMLNTSENTSSYYLVKVGLNAEGPYFFDMWDKYMWPTIIAICSFFGFLLIAAIFIILYHFRYRSPKKEGDDSDTETEELDGGKEDAVKHAALTDHEKTGALPLHNGNASHTYENPTFKDDAHPHVDASHTHDDPLSFKEDAHHPHKADSDSDDEDLTSL